MNSILGETGANSKRILFVDDDLMILQGLQRLLRSQRHAWDMAFVGSAQDALERLASEHFDVVVSDMRMPEMDGGQLLYEIQQQYPEVIRIILSGHADQEMVMNALGVAHQYLHKPCDPETLKTAIERALSLRTLFKDEPTLKPLILQLKTLPSLPSLYQQITAELRSPNVTLNSIGEIISQDVAMTAKILQLVNSAFFGLYNRVSSPEQAISLLGLDTLQALVLSTQIFSQFESAAKQVDLEALWRHNTLVGMFAKKIAAAEGADKQTLSDAMVGGMLHEVGRLVLLANLPGEYFGLVELAKREDADLYVLEELQFGASHAEVGGYLLGLWGLPDAIVEAVTFHHQPAKCQHRGFSALTAVHVADALAHKLTLQTEPTEDGIDLDYLGPLAERLPAWEALCRRTLERSQGA